MISRAVGLYVIAIAGFFPSSPVVVEYAFHMNNAKLFFNDVKWKSEIIYL